MDFSIIMRGKQADAEEFRDLVFASRVPYGAKSGPRVHLGPTDSDPNIYSVEAHELSPKLVRGTLRDKLVQNWRSHSYAHLSVWTDDYLFDFSDMPAELLDSLLDGFLRDPRRKIFPPFSTLSDGCGLCLQNSLALIDDAQELLKQRNEKDLGPATFLLVTAIEEFGKALIIRTAAKEASDNKHKIAIIDTRDGFRDHSEKVGVASEQLKCIAINGHIEFTDLLTLLDPFAMGETDLEVKRGSLGSVHREYGLYVNYSTHSKTWWSYKKHWDPLTSIFTKRNMEDLVKLLKISCDAFMHEIQQKSIDEVREPKEILNSIFFWTRTFR